MQLRCLGIGSRGWCCKPADPETNSSHLKIGRAPIGKDCLPTIHFHWQAVSFREGNDFSGGIEGRFLEGSKLD